MARSRGGRPGQSPFSSDYAEITPPPPRRNRPAVPDWLPSGNVLIVAFVLFVTALVAIVGGQRLAPGPGKIDAPQVAAAMTPTNVAPPTAVPTEIPTPKPTAQPAGPTPTQMPGIAVTPVVTEAPVTTDPNAILPKYRVLAFYGHPHVENMGILGEYSKEDLYAKLMEEKTAYEAADPTTPVMPAFELIASVAQGYETPDGTWLLFTDTPTIMDYINFTAEKGMILILDIQIGHSTVKAEMDRVEEFLLYPNVHLAIDPEFAMPEGVVPGSAIGGVDAADITYAQERLAKLAADNNLPPKMLIVHQFYEGMITSDSQLAPVPGVQLVIDFDGFGAPADKTTGYTQFITDRPIEFAGIKLFYKQDDPLMMPNEVVALNPTPNLVIYQ